jgi:hypothetical protein
LREGDRVVADGQSRLAAGARVKVTGEERTTQLSEGTTP